MAKNSWFRMYFEVANDPKVQLLSDRAFRAWVNLLCVACELGGRIPRDQIHFRLRIPKKHVNGLLSELSGLFDDVSETEIEPHNWRSRQFVSDVSTTRVQAFRQRKRNVSRNVSRNAFGTPPDTDTDTDTEAAAAPPTPSQQSFADEQPPLKLLDLLRTGFPTVDLAAALRIQRAALAAKPTATEEEIVYACQQCFRAKKGTQRSPMLFETTVPAYLCANGNGQDRDRDRDSGGYIEGIGRI